VIPIRFGPDSRRLFALHHVPADGNARGEGVVLCNPFGQEAIRSQRLYKVLAERLARQGMHCLRFDYFGSGDSDGDDNDADMETWIDDVQRAAEELASRGGGRQISLFGIRWGGTIAALASDRLQTTPARLVLWDPLIDGAQYLRDLAAAHVAAGPTAYGAQWDINATLRGEVEAEAACEALGFPLGKHLKSQISSITAASFASLAANRVCLLGREDAPALASLKTTLADRLPVSTHTVATTIDWMSDEAMNSSLVPADALQAIMSAFAT
jgi:pimeloyl-ACP methyl ester carboxylesterase